MHKNVLSINNSLLLVVDVQEKFKKAMNNSDKVIENISKLIKIANTLEIPVVYTEQYPEGLGKTVERLLKDLHQAAYFEKIAFSCCEDTAFKLYVKESQRKQIIVTGIESHVCVSQTVHDFLAENYQVHVIADAVSSRTPFSIETGLNKMKQGGAILSSVEIALFELLKTSKHPQFRELQKLII